MEMNELVAACGWMFNDIREFTYIELLVHDIHALLPEDPLLKNTREPLADEHDQILRVLERISEKVRGTLLYAPEEFLIKDSGLFDGFALGNKAIISRNILQREEDLQATIAYLLGWFNSTDSYRDNTIDTYAFNEYIVAVRYAALPFHHVDELPGGYRADVLRYSTDTSQRYQYRNKSVPRGHPEDLRPKPPGVLLSGGSNYRNFSHTEKEQESSKTMFTHNDLADVESTRGVQAVTEYLNLFSEDDIEGRFMRTYFRNRRKWAEFFKYAQAEADRFAAEVLGQGGQIADMLERYKVLYTGEGVDSTLFSQPLPVRIANLRNDSSFLIYYPTPPTAPIDRIARANKEQARLQAEADRIATERKQREEAEEKARKQAEIDARDARIMAGFARRANEREPIVNAAGDRIEYVHIRGLWWHCHGNLYCLKDKAYDDPTNMYYVFYEYALGYGDEYREIKYLEEWSCAKWPHLVLVDLKPFPKGFTSKEGLEPFEKLGLVSAHTVVPKETENY